MAGTTAPQRAWRWLIAAKRFVLFALLWLTLSAADPSGLGFGLVAVVAAVWLSLRLLPPGGREVSLIAILPLIPGFLERSIRGGIDVAWRSVHPALPIRPGWYVHRTSLPEGGARVALGSLVSLLPGTLVAGSYGRKLYVHCLTLEDAIKAQVQAEEARIAGTLEAGSREPEEASNVD